MVRATALAALILTGCATTCEPVVQIQRVEIPVAVARAAPDNLLQCSANLPAPSFISPIDKHAVIALDPPNVGKLKQLAARQVQCDSAWRAWAKSGAPK